jgi:NADPH-dependent glutamate synthase beta subunit-like oxidoreductase
MGEEGVEFITDTHIGGDLSAKELADNYDALILAGDVLIALGQKNDLDALRSILSGP